MAKARTPRKTKPTAKRKSIKDGPVWPTRPMPKIEPGPNAEALSAAIRQVIAERTRK